MSVGSVQRMVFPVSALLLLVVGRWALERWQPVGVLNVAVPLLFSCALIRISVYMLRHVFAPGRGRRVWERYVTWAVWIGVAIYIVGLWPDIRVLLDGYGLQKIASNYVSGFIILMDRSVGIGDLVTVDNFTGQLTKMTARYVVVRSLTCTEALIPNETIIDLELGVWIEDPHEGTGVLVSDTYYDVWRAFKQHGIEIPYPQREMRMLDGAAPAPKPAA